MSAQLATEVAETLRTQVASSPQYLRVGQVSPEFGMYAGIARGAEGQPDHHVFLIAGEAEGVTWDKAVAWAAEVGGELPTRREQSILFANLGEEFQPNWYWSSEQHAGFSDRAWGQYFVVGNQFYGLMSYAGRARAVRRLTIL